MKKLIGMMTAVILSIGIMLPAAAMQGTPESEVSAAPGLEIAGGKNAYARIYEREVPMVGTPDPNAPLEIDMVMVGEFIFESDEAAQDAFDEMARDLEVAAGIEKLDGYGDAAMIARVEMPEGFIPPYYNAAMLEGNSIVMVAHMSVDTNKDMVLHILDQVNEHEAETDEVTLGAPGESTGGIFDRLPGTDDEYLGEYTILEDTDLMAPVEFTATPQ